MAAFQGTDRYRVLRRLGAGAMGVVYETVDQQTGRRVALKTLHFTEGEEIYRLKREFRALAGVVHPNLVGLHELVVGDDGAFFTMELVRGLPFVQHVRQGVHTRSVGGVVVSPLEPAELDGLRGLVRQLVEGLDALHSSGHVHRDVKPSNVLVTAEGRVALLDFGVASALGGGARLASEARHVVGTVAYMSPEQGWGAAPLASADWYAVGVMLYEALTGVRPFGDHLLEVLAAKEAYRIVPPADRAPEVPADLDALVMALLQPAPEARPDAAGILQALGVQVPRLTRAVEVDRQVAGLIGRDTEAGAVQRALSLAAGGSPVVLHVSGASGVGKSALVDAVVDGWVRRGAVLCLKGRCHPREDVPFKALDGVVDHISRLLSAAPSGTRRSLMPAEMGALAQLFPVLGGVPEVPLQASASLGGPRARRAAALRAIAPLMQALAGGGPVVVRVEDLQWADQDSVDALRTLLRSAMPLLVVLSYRNSGEGAAVAALQEGAAGLPVVAHRHVQLRPLPDADARGLALRWMGGGQGQVRGRVLSRVVELSGGSPFVIAELARAAREGALGDDASLADLFRARVGALPVPARRLLEIIAVAGRPVRRDVAEVAALLGDGAPAAIGRLAAAQLIRRGDPAGQERLEVYHARVRDSVVAGMDSARRRECHGNLAQALRGMPDPEDRLLLGHVAEAGDAAGAALLAEGAARSAAEGLAFHLAAELYQQSLRLVGGGAGRWRVASHRAAALSEAGREGEAAEAFDYALQLGRASRADGDPLPTLEERELEQRAADAYLRSGRLGDGLGRLAEVVAHVDLGMPASPLGALGAIGWARVRLRLRGFKFKPVDASALDVAAVRRADTCWDAAVGLCWVDSLRSGVFQSRFTLLALELGEPRRVAWALGTEAAFICSEGGASNRRRADGLMLRAREIVAEVDDVRTAAIVEVCAAAAAWFGARYADALAHSERAEALIRSRGPGMSWEVTNCHIFGVISLAYLGEMDRLRKRLPRLLRAAEERGDVLAAATLSTGFPTVVWLAEDRPAVARRHADDAMALWARHDSFHSQHYMNLLARAQIDLYEGQGLAAWRRVQATWPRMKSAQMLRLQVIRMEALHLRGRCALACVADGELAAPLLKQVRADARALGKEDVPWGAALRDHLLAGVAVQEGRVGDAVPLLAAAISGLDDAGLRLHSVCARRSWAHLAGDQAQVRAVADWMDARGVVRADRLEQVLSPGFTRVRGEEQG